MHRHYSSSSQCASVNVAAAATSFAVRPALMAATAAATAALAYASSLPSSAAAAIELNTRTNNIGDDYELGRKIGAGAYAHVLLGTCRSTGEQVAIKVIPRQRGKGGSEADDKIRHEVSVLQRVSMHKNIAKLEAFYETDATFYLVMEYVSGGELLDQCV